MTRFQLFTFIILMCTGCSSNPKPSGNEEPNSTLELPNKKLEQEGYTHGAIKFQEFSSCKYVIIASKSDLMFDPVNINEELFEDYKKDGMAVYFKYRPLRMANRCEEAQPIKLEDIKKGS